MNSLVEAFLAAHRFAVVGASSNRNKFGNKVRGILLTFLGFVFEFSI